MSHVRYAPWMIVELRSEYHEDGLCRGLRLKPTVDTSLAMRDLRMRAKSTTGTLVIICEVDGSGRPRTLPPADLRLRFMLEVDDVAFFNAHNVDLNRIRRQRFYFTNASENAVPRGAEPPLLCLNRRAQSYAAAAEYEPGELAYVAGHTFECLIAGTGNDPTAASGHWLDRGEGSYAGGADFVSLWPRASRYGVDAAGAFEVGVYARDAVSGAYDRQVSQERVVLPLGESSDEVFLDLRHLPPARYRVEINAQRFDVYLDDVAAVRGALGVVELEQGMASDSAYSPLDDEGVLRGVRYTIPFANRYARWRYHAPLGGLSAIVRENGDAAPFVQDPASRDFVSDVLLGLRESRDANRFVFDVVDGAPAPRPDPVRTNQLSFAYDADSDSWREATFTMRLTL